MSDAPSTGSTSTNARYRDLALRLINERQRRSLVLGDDWMHGGAGWSFLLLFSSQEDDEDGLPLSQAAKAAGVSPVQALRWMMVLAERGLVDEGPEKAAERYFKLSGRGVQLMQQYLGAL